MLWGHKSRTPGHDGVFPAHGVFATDSRFDIVNATCPQVIFGIFLQERACFGKCPGAWSDPDAVDNFLGVFFENTHPFQDVFSACLLPVGDILPSDLTLIIQILTAPAALTTGKIFHARQYTDTRLA